MTGVTSPDEVLISINIIVVRVSHNHVILSTLGDLRSLPNDLFVLRFLHREDLGRYPDLLVSLAVLLILLPLFNLLDDHLLDQLSHFIHRR